MEFALGGVAACCAGVFTNPLEVVKTRMQLQGELLARGMYIVRYKNVFHAFYAIGKTDGILALQKGLVPALWYQLFLNGIRLGTYQTFVDLGLTKAPNGDVSFIKSVVAGAVAGCFGGAVGSPMYLVKTHLQSQAASSIAVGHQHNHQSTSSALYKIFCDHGVRGLWRGVSAAIPRVMVGSGLQLSTFSKSKDLVENFQIFPRNSRWNAFSASMLSGCVVVMGMTPFDVVSTRLYNQGVDANGKGLFYSSVFDCFKKIFQKEGIFGFYKGWSASLFRLGPHTILTLVFWNEIRYLNKEIQLAKATSTATTAN
ncbi:hypothetical protein CHUAL_001331 [Chamberlinius hualienensis]